MKPFTIVLPFTQDELDRYLEQTPTPVFLVDPEGTVVSANSAMCALCGYEKAALIGSPLRTLVEDEAFLDGLYGPSPAMLPQFRRIDLRIR